MARYFDDFQGIIGHGIPGRGMDPNYRGAYGGMRMRGGGGYQAAYGRYRMDHADELGGAGGFRGRYGGGGIAPGSRHGAADRYDSGIRERYDRGWRDGGRGSGVRDIRYDRELLSDFNAASPALRRGGRYDEGHLRPLPRGVAPWSRRGDDWWDYSNRGLTDAGYSEGWAWGPMRGSR